MQYIISVHNVYSRGVLCKTYMTRIDDRFICQLFVVSSGNIFH